MSLRAYLKKQLGVVENSAGETARLRAELDEVRLLTATGLIGRLGENRPVASLRDTEFRVFSQFGDDGIIQYLIHRLGLRGSDHRFVEFGVETYVEANTRLLLKHNNWSGLVLDGSESNVRTIRQDPLFWMHDLQAVQAFISRENINGLLEESGFSGELGLLSVDIDGNDYWVWEAITAVNAKIVIIEYNSVFGPAAAITIPYDPAFQRFSAHSSGLYWGASIRALELISKRKGYVLVGGNSAGNNAYFLREDIARAAGFSPVTAAEAYVTSKFRESRDPSGKLTYLSGTRRLEAIKDQTVHDVEAGRLVKIADLAQA